MTKDNCSNTYIEHSSEQLSNLKGDKSSTSILVDSEDDELQQVLQKSAEETKNKFRIDKLETRIIDTDLTKEEKGFNNNPITLRMDKTRLSFVHSECNRDTLDQSDSDNDEELAQAIENSKTDTRYCEIDDRLQDSSMPLMQYHCSLTKSVTCSTKSPQKKNVNLNEYRPKINRNIRSDLSKTPERHKSVDYLNKNINSLISFPGKTGNLPEKGMQRTTESLQSMTTYSRLHNLSRQAREALCKTNTLNSDRTIPYLDVNYNVSSNRIDANSNNTSMLFKTSQSVLQDDQNNINPGCDKYIPVRKNHKTNLNLIQDKSNIEQHVMDIIEHSNRKKRRMRLNINPDGSNIETNVINVDTNRNMVRSKISEHTARPTNFVSIDIESPKNDATDKAVNYNSDEDLFDESPALAYTRKSRELDKSKVYNEQQFEAEIESDRSSLDSLPEIEFLPRGEEKFSSPLGRNSISRNLIAESSRISSTPFPDVSVNLAIHALDSRKNNSKYLSGPKEESYDLSIIHQNQRYKNANEITHSTTVDNLREGPRTKQTKRKNNNYAIANDNDIHEKIDQIITVLPQLDRERCFWLLHKFLGNVESCIEHVLLEENQSNPGEVINLDD